MAIGSSGSALVALNAPAKEINHAIEIDWKQFNEELDSWTESLKIIKQKSESKDTSNGRICKVHNRKLKSGRNSWDLGKGDRDRFKPAAKKIVSQIFHDHIRSGATILELGSNTIETEHSYLSSLVPPEYMEGFIFSDFLPQVVQEQALKTKYRYEQVNAKRIEDKFSKSSLDAIVSLSTLDTIEESKIPKIARSAFETLKEGGHFIVFTDREPHHLARVAKHSDQGLFVTYVLKNGFIFEIKAAPKKIVEANIEKQKKWMPKEYANFFTDFLTATQLQRHDFLLSLYRKNKYKIFDALLLFLPEEGLITEKVMTSYYQTVENELSAAGFKILLSEKKSACENIPRFLHVKEQVVEYDSGSVNWREPSRSFPENVKIISNVYVIVGKKFNSSC